MENPHKPQKKKKCVCKKDCFGKIILGSAIHVKDMKFCDHIPSNLFYFLSFIHHKKEVLNA